jgi:hypothetical protein
MNDESELSSLPGTTQQRPLRTRRWDRQVTGRRSFSPLEIKVVAKSGAGAVYWNAGMRLACINARFSRAVRVASRNN